MARLKVAGGRPPPAHKKPESNEPKNRKLSNAERSSYFARREAAKVLQSVLQGDARRRAIGSIKTLIYSPTVRNKRATFALVCQTLKHLPIIKDVLEAASILNSKWKRQGELMYIITYDMLFGQAASLTGDAEKFLLLRKDPLQSALARILVREGVKTVAELVAHYKIPDVSKPRYVRVNTLKLDVDSAMRELGKENKVHKDEMVPDLLILPPGTDLHNHPLVTDGSVFLQGKASSMVAVALSPKPGWEVLDACSAPGNKTVHLSALMKGKGKIIACELNKDRVKRLQHTINLAGAANVQVLHEDFLNLHPENQPYSKNSVRKSVRRQLLPHGKSYLLQVRAILLDPSCSGSGTTADRLDHLLPSYNAGDVDGTDVGRLRKLAAFQQKALAHALSFPSVEKVVYSTCSINQIENEDVIKSVLPLATSKGFQLATPFLQWPRRGLPVVEGSECLLRTDPVEDKEGFFIALFIRKPPHGQENGEKNETSSSRVQSRDGIDKENKYITKRRFTQSILFPKMSRMWLLHGRSRTYARRTQVQTESSHDSCPIV